VSSDNFALDSCGLGFGVWMKRNLYRESQGEKKRLGRKHNLRTGRPRSNQRCARCGRWKKREGAENCSRCSQDIHVEKKRKREVKN